MYQLSFSSLTFHVSRFTEDPLPQTQPVSEQLVLKEDQVFVTSNSMGDMPSGDSLGLYYNDTRYLSLYTLTIEGKEPVLLSASSEHNFMANLQLTNPALGLENGYTLLSNTISLRRNRLVQGGGMRERIGLFNYNQFPVRLRLRLELGADFRDMFDVRGFPRSGRGTLHEPIWQNSVLTLAYTGLDGRQRHTSISFDPDPHSVSIVPAPLQPVEHRLDAIYPGNAPTVKEIIVPPAFVATWDAELTPHKPWFMNLTVVPEGPSECQPAFLFDNDARDLRSDYQEWYEHSTSLRTDNEVFDSLLHRSLADLRVLTDRVPGGLFPAAGIPWYSVPFGRDSLITGLQTLLFNPGLARGTLRYLARHQGTRVDSWRDEEPGKILHELRFGEMATLNEIPHTPYYGTVDATPLFVMLFVETMRWTGDGELYADLLPNVMRALEWMDKYGDHDGDGFVEYAAKSRWGVIRNQGWKDSYDSLKFRDGRLPEPPIALVEVQAYVYAAKAGMADLLMSRGDHINGARLAREALLLKQHFNHDFWMPSAGFYAQALDGSKRKVPSVSSNAGHALYCGIAGEEQAAGVVRRLMADDMLCGWGLRTLSSHEPNFNPMSYHNGSIWPHDNAIIAAGMRRYGFHKEAAEVMEQVVQAAIRFRLFRLPELYCGFARDLRYYSVPAEYPVSCSPQAWAAGSVLHFCQTMLGATPDAAGNRLTVDPYFLPSISELSVDHLMLGATPVDFRVSGKRSKTRPRLLMGDNPGGIRVQSSRFKGQSPDMTLNLEP
jgi:glycogen debranching enzyme